MADQLGGTVVFAITALGLVDVVLCIVTAGELLHRITRDGRLATVSLGDE